MPGVAAAQLSDELKQEFASVPWRRPARLRNRIVHGYWSIDLDVDAARVGFGSGSHERRLAGPEVDVDIAAALDEAAQTMAKIPEDIQTPVTERLQRQITSLDERAIPISPHR